MGGANQNQPLLPAKPWKCGVLRTQQLLLHAMQRQTLAMDVSLQQSQLLFALSDVFEVNAASAATLLLYAMLCAVCCVPCCAAAGASLLTSLLMCCQSWGGGHRMQQQQKK